LDELDEFHPKSESVALLAIEIDGNGGKNSCDLLFVRHLVGICVFLFLASCLSWRYYGGFYFDNVRLFLVFSYSCCLETLVVCVCVVSLCFWWDVSYGAMVTFDKQVC
jgi:hypothetical protein